MPTKTELAAKLSRKGRSGRKPLNEKTRTNAQQTALKYRVTQIVRDWQRYEIDSLPSDEWIDARVAETSPELRDLRTAETWRWLIRKRLGE